MFPKSPNEIFSCPPHPAYLPHLTTIKDMGREPSGKPHAIRRASNRQLDKDRKIRLKSLKIKQAILMHYLHGEARHEA